MLFQKGFWKEFEEVFFYMKEHHYLLVENGYFQFTLLFELSHKRND